MARFDIPDHPVIACMERTGYPPWMQDEDDEDLCDEDDEDYESEFWGDPDEDDLYEESRERELFGEW